MPLPAATNSVQLSGGKTEVVVTDIRMPFGSMVVFMIKWALAAIPAFIILAVLWFLVTVVFMGGCASMLGNTLR